METGRQGEIVVKYKLATLTYLGDHQVHRGQPSLTWGTIRYTGATLTYLGDHQVHRGQPSHT